MLIKKCIFCGKSFTKSYNCSLLEWNNRRKFCSRECKNKSQLGKPSWNKGLTKKTDVRVKKNAFALMGIKKDFSNYSGKKHHFFGKSPSEETLKKKSKAISGNKHWNWQNGKTEYIHRLRNLLRYRNWRKKVYERDKFTCQKCGLKKSGYLEAHHKKSFAEYPKLRFRVNNGLTLCKSCHSKITLHS